MYDIVHTPGVAADLSHIDTPAKVEGFNAAENLETALKNADVVIIPAGVPRKPGKIEYFYQTSSIMSHRTKEILQNVLESCIRLRLSLPYVADK